VQRRRRQIAAYGVCRDERGRVLLVPDGTSWRLPGGIVAHGEHPIDTVARAFGVPVVVGVVREVSAVMRRDRRGLVHTDRLVFDVAGNGVEVPGRWAEPGEFEALVDVSIQVAAGATGRRERFQRFAAYGLVTDPDGRILLARIATGYPGAGRWHLPGGGTDFGEQPADGLMRELTEETGQYGRITGLVGVSHRHNPEALGREGYPIDWHSVRVLYRMAVDVPTEPRVIEAAGGSTAHAAWFEPGEISLVEMSEVAAAAIRG